MINRREFINYSVLASSLLIAPSRVFGANERVNIAFIGIGGKGLYAIKSLGNHHKKGRINFIAFADVSDGKASHARKMHPEIPYYNDFRLMLDACKDQIDGIIVSTPDHTHHYIAATCMLAGKHVYLEKPLAHNIKETRHLMQLEKETGLACQMGNQGHSGGGLLMLDSWIRSGQIGKVENVHAWANPRWSFPDNVPPTHTVPSGFKWDHWLGPAQARMFSRQYVNSWRGWFDFGSGSLGDWFCHNADAPYTALDLDCPRLVEVKSTGPNKLSFPESVKLTFTFPANNIRGEVKIHWYQGERYMLERPEELEAGKQFGSNGGGTLIYGSKATVLTGSHAGIPRITPEHKMKDMVRDLPRPNTRRSSHWDNWLLAIQGKEVCRSNFAYGGRLTECFLFGNIAMHVNRNLTIDPIARTIIGDEAAAQMMNYPAPRATWRI